jgi:hypothetical protein
MSGLRVLVCGGRDFRDRNTVYAALNATMPAGADPIVVIHGACPTGADSIADEWVAYCGVNGVRAQRFPADWKTYGRAAGPLRNDRMIAEGKPDLVIAFKGGRGTQDCCRKAEAAGVPVRRVGW